MTDSVREPTKAQWRARLRTRSSAGLSPVSAEQADAICGALAEFVSSTIEPDMRVVVYDALGDEIDLSPLIESHGQPERRFAVTRTPDSGFALTVHPWGGPLELHKYGYRQPSHDAPVIEDRQIGAVLVPAMAFDVAGNRLGRGKGYYDRLLARLATSPSQRPTSVMFIGMAGGVLADDLPHDDHDVAMTHLALTTGVYPAPVRSPMTDGVEMLSFA